MSRAIIDIKHHVCDGCCMWSGIEDIYTMRTNEKLPMAFMFALSSYGETAYLKFKDEERPRMLSLADGRTRKTYERMTRFLGLKYHITEGCSYQYSLRNIKKEIDNGQPVIIGPIDMFYLPYLKMYHFVHIPIHYVLMTGYDDEKQCIYIYDCGREELQTLSYEELKSAWDIENSIVGKKNGFIRFTLPEKPATVYELAKACLKDKAASQLTAKPSFVGVKAFERIASEFPDWRKSMGEANFKNAVSHLVESFGTVPKQPDRLLGMPDNSNDIAFKGCYDRLAGVLAELGTRFNEDSWICAADLFSECGDLVEKITEKVCDFYFDSSTSLAELPDMFRHIGELQKKAYKGIIGI